MLSLDTNQNSKNLLITGANLRENGFQLGEGKYYDTAKLIRLDVATGKFEILISEQFSGTNYPEETPNVQFTAGCVENDILWLPTDTEVRAYRYPTLTLEKIYSHPCFQNVHSAAVIDEQLIVTSTGLDFVVILNKQTGAVEQVVNCEGKPTWHRFDPSTDYRQVHSTRPHDCHPNYVIKLDGDLWVTRCKQEDAFNLRTHKCIDISGEKATSVHDGIISGDKIYYTTVDGCLVIVDKNQLKVTEHVDLFEKEKNRPLGWCRGLHIDDSGIFYIGFSKLRQTKLKSKLAWMAKGNFKFSAGNNALIVAYDINKRKVISYFETPDGLIDAIYSILPEPTL